MGIVEQTKEAMLEACREGHAAMHERERERTAALLARNPRMVQLLAFLDPRREYGEEAMKELTKAVVRMARAG